MKEKRVVKKAVYHIIVFVIGIIMIYPLIWMVMSSFKENSTIFSTAGSLIPEKFIVSNYSTGWKGKSILFAAMLLSMMLPAQVLMIPQYLWYQKLGWVGSYMPLTVPYFFAIQGFFVYLISNFISGIPTELDEAAKIDGCSYAGIFTRIMLPLIKPALVTACIFSFMWRWDDFLSARCMSASPACTLSALRLSFFATRARHRITEPCSPWQPCPYCRPSLYSCFSRNIWLRASAPPA